MTSTSSRSGPVWISWSSVQLSAMSCTWVSICTGWGIKGLRAALRRRTCGYWLRSSTWPGSAHLQPRRPNISWAVSKGTWSAKRGRGFCPSTLLWWDPARSLMSSSGALSTGKTWTCWSRSRGGQDKSSEAWNPSPVRKGWESQGCSAWRREGSGFTLLQPSST